MSYNLFSGHRNTNIFDDTARYSGVPSPKDRRAEGFSCTGWTTQTVEEVTATCTDCACRNCQERIADFYPDKNVFITWYRKAEKPSFRIEVQEAAGEN